MTGTDSLMPRLVTGFAVHQELKELVDIGLTVRGTPRLDDNSYEYLGESKDAGTIEVGKRPDLLLDDPIPSTISQRRREDRRRHDARSMD